MDWFIPLSMIAGGLGVAVLSIAAAMNHPNGGTERIGQAGFIVGAAVAVLGVGIAMFMAVAWSLSPSPAAAHEAPTGWSYPFACCSGFDCRPAKVAETPTGFVVPSGEIVPMTDSRVRPSPDGLFHWCSVAGADDGRTICLFTPPRSF